jgi:TonB family protein
MLVIQRPCGLVFGASVLSVFLLIATPAYLHAQQPGSSADQNTARGIQLYQQGDAVNAVKVLKDVVKKDPKNADAWYYLGLAFYTQGLIAQARPCFERLIVLRPDSADARAKLAYALILGKGASNALSMAQRALELGDHSPEAHYTIAEASLSTGQWEKAIAEAETALSIDPGFRPALVTASVAHYQLKQYSEAATSLEKLLALRPTDVDTNVWRNQVEFLRRNARPTTPEVFNARDITQRARVLAKPEPTYTEEARRAGVEGTVILRAVFASDGEVKDVFVVSAVGYGLTTRAVEAAYRIRFTPALKNDKPASQYVQLEYNFNLY